MGKIRLKHVLCMTMAIPLLTMAAACSNTAAKKDTGTAQPAQQNTPGTAKPQEVTLSYLSAWNGGGAGFPKDQVNNPIAQKIKEKTGITLKMESIVTSEVEKLNTMFASDTVPDMVNAPFWTTQSGAGAIIKKAALEGQLLDLTPYLDKYPNVKKLMTVGVAKDFNEFELKSPDFKGKTYVIPMQTPDGTPQSITNWKYGVYARGDILKALNVNPADIDTEDKLYDLLVKIKNGNFKDISGKPVIPSGGLHNGWDYTQLLAGWSDYNISDFRQESGKLTFWTLAKDQEPRLMYMRKLISNGLFDPESFSNTDTTENEKLSTGKLAVFGAQDMLGKLQNTLYKTNPEMQYELLGPFKNESGNIATQVEKPGRSGFPVVFLSAKTKNADAALRLIDYANSDEGHLLNAWGIEGSDYTMVNGKPQWIPEVKQKFDSNPALRKDEGIGMLGGFIGAFSANVAWPTPEDQKTQWQKLDDSFGAKMPIKIIDKVSATYLEMDWPKYKQYTDATSSLNFEDELRKAYFAKTDSEALDILHKIQDKYRAAGAQEMADYVAQKAAARNDVAF